MTRTILLTLALMCENVHAAPQDQAKGFAYGRSPQSESGFESRSPAGAAPLLTSPIQCRSGVWIRQEILTWQDRKIVKRVWHQACLLGTVTPRYK